MFPLSTPRVKDGKTHRYFSVVENRRLRSGAVVQRAVLYRGEINNSQQAVTAQKTISREATAERRASVVASRLYKLCGTVPGLERPG